MRAARYGASDEAQETKADTTSHKKGGERKCDASHEQRKEDKHHAGGDENDEEDGYQRTPAKAYWEYGQG